MSSHARLRRGADERLTEADFDTLQAWLEYEAKCDWLEAERRSAERRELMAAAASVATWGHKVPRNPLPPAPTQYDVS